MPRLARDHHELNCTKANCFLCIMKESNSSKRTSSLSRFFKHLPVEPQGQCLSVSALWSLAMARPNDPELVEQGVLSCMASLICKGLDNRRWLLKEHNIFIPYYAAHIIGSFTMNRADFAEIAVIEGVIPPLMELLRGRLTWVEQRAAVRGLGHIAAFENTFPAIAAAGEVLELAMELAVSALDIVYSQFVRCKDRRLRYHRDLVTRGMRGPDMESRKGEEWASQLQCWSLQLINCFAIKEKYVPMICRPGFLTKLPGMWGGLMNENSPAGMGLLLTLCHHKLGRSSVAACPIVVHALCNTARSSDDWQHMAVECLLLLLQDSQTRRRVFDEAVVPLVDLAVQPCSGERRKLGRVIVDTLLQQDIQSPIRGRMSSSQARYSVDDLADQRDRLRWEKSMPKDDLGVKQQAAHVVKLEGNAKFSAGDIIGAVYKYSEALSLCPLRATRERVVLHSNRAQCHLLLQDPESAISDTTRALCLYKPMNGHGRSLWRRAQAYEMLGLYKESLLDAIMFINECSTANSGAARSSVPDYAERLVKKQMRATWLFLESARRHGDVEAQACQLEENKDDDEEKEDGGEDSEWETASESDTNLVDDTTDQGSCSKDDGESDNQLEIKKPDHNWQKLTSLFKGMDMKKQCVLEENPFGGNELDEKKGRPNLPMDKELLKKRIYTLIQERRLLKKHNEEKKCTN